MTITSSRARTRLDTRDGLLAELTAVEEDGWDGATGRKLLAYVHSHLVRPQVVAAGLRGPAADQAEATGWAAAWEVLNQPSIRTATSPWGLVWVTVRRAVLGEVVAGTHVSGARNGWRVERARREQQANDGQGRASEPPVSLSVLVEDGWEPTAQPIEPGVELGPRLEQVVAGLVYAGWEQRAARAVVEAVADTALSDGKASGEVVGWRLVAARLGLPPWQVRRVTVLLLGAPGWPGVIERMALEGCHVLHEPSIKAAVRSTTLSRWPPPPAAARRAGLQADESWTPVAS